MEKKNFEKKERQKTGKFYPFNGVSFKNGVKGRLKKKPFIIPVFVFPGTHNI